MSHRGEVNALCQETDDAVQSYGAGLSPDKREITLFNLREGMYRVTATGYPGTFPELYWNHSFEVDVYKGTELIETVIAPVTSPQGAQEAEVWRVLEIHVTGNSAELDSGEGEGLGYIVANGYWSYLQQNSGNQ